MMRTNQRSRLASLRSLPTQGRSIWSFGRETRSADLVTLTSRLVPLVQAVRDARPSSLALCRAARMTTIGANWVYRLPECLASPGQISKDDPTLAFELLSKSRRISAS